MRVDFDRRTAGTCGAPGARALEGKRLYKSHEMKEKSCYPNAARTWNVPKDGSHLPRVIQCLIYQEFAYLSFGGHDD